MQTILNIARSLKISVVAEGVETELQAVLLRNLGCHIFQGYFFGKPMPEEASEPMSRAANAPVEASEPKLARTPDIRARAAKGALRGNAGHLTPE